MSTVIFPIPKDVAFGEITEMLDEILERIDRRLQVIKQTESAAAKNAGLSDSAIRDMRRAVKAGDVHRGVSTKTLIALAPVLKTTAAWLLEECGPEHLEGPEARELYEIMNRAPDGVRRAVLDFARFQMSSNYTPEEARATAT
jgi:hypothetical protein